MRIWRKILIVLCILALISLSGCAVDLSGKSAYMQYEADQRLLYVAFSAGEEEADPFDYTTIKDYKSEFAPYNSYVLYDTLNNAEQLVYRFLEYALDHSYTTIFIDERLLADITLPVKDILDFLCMDSPFVEQNYNYVRSETSYTFSYAEGKYSFDIPGTKLEVNFFSEDKLENLRKSLAKCFPDRTALVIPADLSKRGECFRLYEEACAQAGKENITFVANNAGMGVYGLFLETDLNKELDLIDLNVTSVHILSKLFLRDMAEKGRGVLMNVGSCAGFMSGPTFSSYYASKNYVVRLTEAIHEELRRAGSPVKVSCLCPGPTDTAFNHNSGVAVSGKQISAVQAAKEGVDGALQGKMIVIPGRKMPIIVTASRLLGEHLSTRINYLLQVKKAGPS